MKSKLRAILKDPVLLLLVAALLIQSYRVADMYDFGSGPGTATDQAVSFKGFVERFSEDGSIDVPRSDGSSATFSLPRSADGKPIDLRKLFTEGGPQIEESYLRAEQEYGPEDLRTVRARSAYAAVLLYRGEQSRSMELYQKNYDIAIDAENMAPDQRLEQLLVSASALNEHGGVDYSHRLIRALLVARVQAQRAPAQAARILNRVASMYVDNGDFEVAHQYYGEAAGLPLNWDTDKSVIAETLLGLTVTLYRTGDVERSQEAAERLLALICCMPESQFAERDTYVTVATEILSRTERSDIGKIVSTFEQRLPSN